MLKRIALVNCFLLLLLTMSYSAPNSNEKSNERTPPQDVQDFLKKSQECSYWIETWNPQKKDAANKNAEEKINTVCLDVINERPKLQQKYDTQSHILKLLN